MEELRRYRWPGNIRELRNVIERSVIRTSGNTLLLSMSDDARPRLAHGAFMGGFEREGAGASHLRVVER
jgi:transcriptional regulator with PAS, ATPase and Fis domain